MRGNTLDVKTLMRCRHVGRNRESPQPTSCELHGRISKTLMFGENQNTKSIWKVRNPEMLCANWLTGRREKKFDGSTIQAGTWRRFGRVWDLRTGGGAGNERFRR